MPKKYTLEELASELKVSRRTILREIKRGKLKTERVGRRHLITSDAVASYLGNTVSDIRPRINEYLREKKSEMLSVLQKWVSLATDKDERKRERLLAVQIKDFLESHNIRSVIYENEGSVAVRGTYGYGDNGLLFDCPLDSVAAGDLGKWSYPAYDGVISQGRMYGRGTADCKAGIVAMIYSVLALKQFVPEDKVRIELVFDGGEQNGQYQGVNLVLNKGLSVKAGIVGYAGDMNEIVIGGRGYQRYTFTAHGKSVHTGSRFKPGVNAISKMAKLITELESKPLPKSIAPYFSFGPRLTFSLINGGTAINIVPDSCTASLDVRTTPEMDKFWVDTYIEAVLKKLREQDKELEIDLVYICGQESYLVEEKEPLLSDLSMAIESTLHKKLPFMVSGPANIGNLLSEYKIPIIVFGPKGDNVHSYDEYIEIDSLPLTASIYAQTVLNYFHLQR